MVYYTGSKAAHADEILSIILPKRKPKQTWAEPFVGGANIICRVPDKDGPRIGGDVNPYMIAYLKALADGWEPPTQLSEKEYTAIKNAPKKFRPELVGFAGTACSFGSHWFDTYARGKSANGDARNYARESHDQAMTDAPGLKGATFVHSSYDQLPIPPNSLIYCDPPYINTAGYMDEHQEQWRAYKFWRWADKMVDEGHTVFVSEYTDPRPGDIYKASPITPEHKAVMQQLETLRQEMFALGDKPTPPVMTQRREALYAQAREFEERRMDEPRRLAARWKVVWQKEVKVNFAAVNVDKSQGEQAKTEVEKLFHREA